MEEVRVNSQQAVPLINVNHCYLVTDHTGMEFTENVQFESPGESLCMESQPLCGKKDVSSNNKKAFRHTKKIKRPYSPDFLDVNKLSRKKRKRRKKIIPKSALNVNIPAERFSCERCHTSYIIDPLKSHSHRDSPRRVVDLETQKTLLLCNACGISMIREAQRKENPKKKKFPKNALNEMKEVFLKEGADYAASLAESFNEPDIRRFVCTFFTSKGCGCLKSYLSPSNNDKDELQSRVNHLLYLLRQARNLNKQRDTLITDSDKTTLTDDNKLNRKRYRRRALLLNKTPRQRSKQYEDFVLNNRLHLRDELKLCESASKRILLYSNNFLHKNTHNFGRRMKKKLGKRDNGLLHPIRELAEIRCCRNLCSVMASSHSKLLEHWRSAAGINQKELRIVLAEMLTPSGGKTNCYKFISMVTGCATATIAHVKKQMKVTQGERNPLEHGLKKWWREHKGDKNKKTGAGECSGKDINVNEQTEMLTEPTSVPMLLTNINNEHQVTENSSFVHVYLTETANGLQETADDPTDISLFTAEEVENVLVAGDDAINIPSAEELSSLDFHEARRRLQLEREKLLKLQERLTGQNIISERIQDKIKIPNKVSNRMSRKIVVPAAPLVSHSDVHTDIINVEGLQQSQQILHIVQIPPAEDIVSQSQISLVTSSRESEPLLLLMDADNTTLETSSSQHIINPSLAAENCERVDVISCVPDSVNEPNSFQVYSVVDSPTPSVVYLNY